MPVNIHGKQYKTVAERIGEMRTQDATANWTIDTDLISNADMVVIKATVSDEHGRLIGSGYAEEERGSTNINKTSAVENCETSAIGRALAACGFAGTEYASANEVSDAIINQEVLKAIDKHIRLGKALQDNFESIAAIKSALANDEMGLAVEAYYEISDGDKQSLSVASTKGGIWTVAESQVFKSNEWKAARDTHYGR